jgi:hypothetical protein
VAGCCECGDEPSGSCATELVSFRLGVKKLYNEKEFTGNLSASIGQSLNYITMGRFHYVHHFANFAIKSFQHRLLYAQVFLRVAFLIATLSGRVKVARADDLPTVKKTSAEYTFIINYFPLLTYCK